MIKDDIHGSSLTGTANIYFPYVKRTAVNPPRHQILRIEREEMIDDVISHDKGCHLCQKCSLIPIDIYIAHKQFIFSHIIT